MLGQSKRQSPCFGTQNGPQAQFVQLLSSSHFPLAGGIILVITMIIRALIIMIIMVRTKDFDAIADKYSSGFDDVNHKYNDDQHC